MKLKKLIQDYLQEAKMMQLATSVGDQPWVCHVWFAADEDLNIYWFSSTARRHSKEVIKNNKVAGAVVLPQTPKDPPRGLQFQGVAEMLTNEEDVKKAVSVYQDRIFSKGQIEQFRSSKESPHEFYKITPTQFVLFDLVNFPGKPRQEYNL